MNARVDTKTSKHMTAVGAISNLRGAVSSLRGFSNEVCNPRPKAEEGKPEPGMAESLEDFLDQASGLIDTITADIRDIESELREALL